MEKTIIDAISLIGFPSVACILLGIYINGRTKKTDERMDRMEVENKEDKKMFQNAVRLFEQSVNEFKSIKDDVKDVKNDVEDIKDIVQFNTKNNEKTR